MSLRTTRRRQFLRRTVLVAASYAACAVLVGAGRDPEFMRYDAVARRVDLSITAALDQSNSGYNLNGGFDGNHRITVPLGWQVRMSFSNHDLFPHSVVVVGETKRLPLRVSRPAFVGAASSAFQQGLPPGGRDDDIVFVANQAGVYLITCGVPAHTALGTYLRLVVSEDAAVPTYEIIRPTTAAVLPD